MILENPFALNKFELISFYCTILLFILNRNRNFSINTVQLKEKKSETLRLGVV